MSHSKRTTRFAHGAMGLCLAGAVGFGILMTLTQQQVLAFFYVFASGLLALQFGIVGWRHRIGKAAVLGTMAVLLGVTAYWLTRSDPESHRPRVISEEPAEPAE